jgi:hypothetical protein
VATAVSVQGTVDPQRATFAIVVGHSDAQA